jgi:hypothetical protein
MPIVLMSRPSEASHACTVKSRQIVWQPRGEAQQQDGGQALVAKRLDQGRPGSFRQTPKLDGTKGIEQ